MIHAFITHSMFLLICGLSSLVLANIPETRPEPGPLSPVQREKILELSNEEYWHRLMHYRKSFPFYNLKSEVDGPGFFFSPKGKTSPSLEMLATAEAFFKSAPVGKLKQHAQCAFPERYKYLKASLQLNTAEVQCPELEQHLARLDPESVALGFSSSYTGNPGSMFGHTFLKINSGPRSKDGKKRLDLLDWGIGFAASVPPDTGGVEFAIRGLAGGFQSQFSLLPYYSKVNEYVNAESRDIWEYELSLNREETKRLVNHFWEIETNSHFDYYFFDENCSYQLMTALEVARPDWKISSFGPHVIPAETVKRLLSVPGAVTSVKYRPSLKRKAIERHALLTDNEKERFDRILVSGVKPGPEDSAALLEAVSTFLQFRKHLNSGEQTPVESSVLRSALLQRSFLGIQPPPQRFAGPVPNEFVETRPEIGHGPYVIGTSSGVSSNGASLGGGQYFQELQFKFAYHDLLNNDAGYGRYSHIDFPNISLRYYANDRRIALDKLTAISLTSINPLSIFEKKVSFGFAVRYTEPKDLECHHCGVAQMEGAVGVALPLASERNTFYALLWTYIDAGSGLGNAVRFGPKPSLGVLLNPWEPYKTQLVASTVFDLFQSQRPNYFFQGEWNQSFSFSKSWEMRSSFSFILPSVSGTQHYREARITLNHFF